MHSQVFYEDLLADYIIDSNHMGELMDFSATVLMDEFTNLSPIF